MTMLYMFPSWSCHCVKNVRLCIFILGKFICKYSFYCYTEDSAVSWFGAAGAESILFGSVSRILGIAGGGANAGGGAKAGGGWKLGGGGGIPIAKLGGIGGGGNPPIEEGKPPTAGGIGNVKALACAWIWACICAACIFAVASATNAG